MPAKQQPVGTERERQMRQLGELMKWRVEPIQVSNWNSDAANLLKYTPDGDFYRAGRIWDPFTSIADAWMLVEKLTEYGFYRIDGNGKVVTFSIYPKISELLWAEGATICEAICETALQFATLSKRQESEDGPEEEGG